MTSTTTTLPTADVGPEVESDRRQADLYESPTPEKRAFGERLRVARETAGMSQIDAAVAMGYSKGVQLSNMEAGNRMPTLRVLLHAAQLYSTTMDYLTGLVGDPSRDPAATAQSIVAARVTGEVRAAIGVLISTSIEHVRRLRPDEAKAVRIANVALEVRAALDRLRQRDPRFDDLSGGATVLHRVELLADLAAEQLAQAAREHVVASIGGAGPVASTALPVEELPVGHSPEALRPLNLAAHAEENDDVE